MLRDDDQIKIGREIFLRSFFQTRPPQRVAQALVGAMEDIYVDPGQTIFTAGAPPTRVFFVVEGRVEFEGADVDPNDHETWSFSEGAVIGIMDAVLGRPRARSAIARSRVHLLALRFQDYLEVLEDNFDFARKALERAFRSVHEDARALAPDQVFKAPQTGAVLTAHAIRERTLTLIERLLVLYNAPMFHSAPVQPLVSVALMAEEVRRSAGQVIIERGEPNVGLSFLVLGQAVATSDDPPLEGAFGPGDLLGAHSAVAYAESLYRVTATEDVVLLRILKEDLFDVMEDHARFTRCGFAFLARENERIRSVIGERQRTKVRAAT